MPQAEDLFDSDFDAQLQGLFQQAEKAIQQPGTGASQLDLPKMAAASPGPEGKESVSASTAPASAAAESTPSALPTFIKPLMQGLEAVLRAATENTALIKRLEATEQSRLDTLEVQKGLPKIVSDLRAVVETRTSVSQGMFSALHEELKSYKDGFLLQSVHRPIIRDVVTVYDDIAELHRQVSEMIAELTATVAEQSPILDRLRQFGTNLSNNLDFIIEVLARLEVTMMPLGTGKLDKVAQRAVSLESAETAEDDGLVVRSLKRGFLWKEAVLRPEEVVIKKWKRTEEPAPAQ